MPDNNDKHTTMKSIGYSEQVHLGRGERTGSRAAGSQAPLGQVPRTSWQNQDVPPSGRLLVSVPGIVTVPDWAMPCVPVAALAKAGGTFVRPMVGANVWVEFERGDPDKPIWVGCCWGEVDLIPMMADGVQRGTRVIQ